MGAYSDISSKITIGLNQFHYGGGGLTSTLIDYLKFLQFLLKSMKSSVPSSTVSKMFRNQIGNMGVSSLKSYNQSLVNDYEMYPNIEKTWGYGLLLNNQPLITGR